MKKFITVLSFIIAPTIFAKSEQYQERGDNYGGYCVVKSLPFYAGEFRYEIEINGNFVKYVRGRNSLSKELFNLVRKGTCINRGKCWKTLDEYSYMVNGYFDAIYLPFPEITDEGKYRYSTSFSSSKEVIQDIEDEAYSLGICQ